MAMLVGVVREYPQLLHLMLSMAILAVGLVMAFLPAFDIIVAALCPGSDQCPEALLLSSVKSVVGGVAGIAMAPILGSLSDKYGRKPFLVLSSSLIALPTAILAASHSRSAVYVYYVGETVAAMVGGGGPGFVIFFLAYVADVVPDREGHRLGAFGAVSGSMMLGFVLGPVLTGLIPEQYCFVCALAFSASAAAYMLLFLPESKPSYTLLLRARSSGSFRLPSWASHAVEGVVGVCHGGSSDDTSSRKEAGLAAALAAAVAAVDGDAESGLPADVGSDSLANLECQEQQGSPSPGTPPAEKMGGDTSPGSSSPSPPLLANKLRVSFSSSSPSFSPESSSSPSPPLHSPTPCSSAAPSPFQGRTTPKRGSGPRLMRSRSTMREAAALFSSSPGLGLLMLVAFLHSFCENGQIQNMFYVFKAMFHWNKDNFALFSAGMGAVAIVSQLVVLPLVARRVPVRPLLLVCFLVSALHSMLYGCAWAPWVVYAALSMGLLTSLISPSLSTVVSKLAGPTDQGKLQGVVAGVSSLASVLAPLTINPITALFLSDSAPFRAPGFGIIVASVFDLVAFSLLLFCPSITSPPALSVIETEEEEEQAIPAPTATTPLLPSN